MRLFIILTLMLATISFAEVSFGEVFTSNIITSEESKAAIIAEKTFVASNKPTQSQKLWIALRLNLADGWHSYANPSGESGYATNITLKLPKGVAHSPIYWQSATAFLTDDILSYGYASEVYHFIELDITPEYWNSKAGDDFSFKAEAQWLICKDICIPEQGKWSVNIPVISNNNDAIIDEDFTAKRKIATVNEAIILSEKSILGEKSLRNPPIKTLPQQNNSMIFALISAFIGGLVLNLMPCVLPILSLKILSLIKIANKSRSLSALHGISYTSGIITGFVALSLIIIALKSTGSAIGWGFQLQSPAIICALALLMLLIALNLSDVFEVPNINISMVNIGGLFKKSSPEKSSINNGLAGNNGLVGSFFTGLLAVSVATPCTAPFMAGAIGFAITKPPIAQIAIFATLGLGLASPYLLISLVPRLQKYLPKSGSWLVHFKHFLAFPIYATSAWLAWVLVRQAGDSALATLFAGALVATILLWSIKYLYSQKWLKMLILIALIGDLWLTIATVGIEANNNVNADLISQITEKYSPQKLADLRRDGKKIFIYATADWCITCKLNERFVLRDDAIAKHLQTQNISVLKADFTNHDAEIAELLAEHGLAGVPAYIYYGGMGDNKTSNKPIILPNLLSDEDILRLR